MDNPAFRRWFGQSVLRNPDGSPMILYHWTTASFTKFRAGGMNPKMSGRAIWLSTDPSQMNAAHNLMMYRYREGKRVEDPRERIQMPYGDQIIEAWEGINALPLYARLENPIQLPDPLPEGTREMLKSMNLPDGPYYLPPEEIAQMKKLGFDGIIKYKPDGSIEEIVVLSPTQVKSVNNRGTFSRRDADILHGRWR